MRILGESGVSLNSRLQIEDVPAGQCFQISGVRFTATSQAVVFRRCPEVLVSDCRITPSPPNLSSVAVILDDSTVAFASCEIGAFGSVAGLLDGVVASTPFLGRGTVMFSGGAIRAGNSTFSRDAAVAAGNTTMVFDECILEGNGPVSSDVTPLGNARVLVSNQLGGLGDLTCDGNLPAEVSGVVPAATLGPSCTAGRPVVRRQPGLVGPSFILRGSPIPWTVHGDSGDLGIAAIGLDTQPLESPGLFDGTFFLAVPGALSLPVAIGANGITNYSISVPGMSSLRNTFVYSQVVGWSGQPTLRISSLAITRIL